MWADTYDYAVRAEWLGVGIWANRQAPPLWFGEEISQAVLRVVSNDTSTADGRSHFHQRAKALATKSREQAGRVVAAREIARMVKREQERSKAPVQGEDILNSNNQVPIQSEPQPAGYDEL
jgi:adenine-specific DNA methylase